MMRVIPAIDIRRGMCVRLFKGDFEQVTEYSDDPYEVAHRWVSQGAKRIHIIDLDGALTGSSAYLDLAARVKKDFAVTVEFGGGLRQESVVERALVLGIDKLILGTSAVEKADWVERLVSFYPDRFMVALDTKNMEVTKAGWTQGSQVSIGDALKTMEGIGFREVLFTDIARDGTLEGPNFEATRWVTENTGMAVFASGGVSNIQDVETLRRDVPKAQGVIVGKALYAGKLSLDECARIGCL